MKKILTLLVILSVVLSIFPIILPTTKAQEDFEPRIMQAEDKSKVTRIGGDYYVGDPDGQGWEEIYKPYSPETPNFHIGHMLFTLGQHDEELQFNFLGTAIIICFYSYRSGIARVIISNRWGNVETNRTVDTYDDTDTGMWMYVSFGVTPGGAGELDYTTHSVRIIATGERNPSSPAEYIYVDYFILYPTEPNEAPTAEISSIVSADTKKTSPFTKNEQIIFNGTGTDLDGWVMKYEWDFDGNGIFEYSSYNNATAIYAYEKAGEYSPRLRVYDNVGAYTEVQYSGVVKVNPLPADLTIAGSDITFTYSGANVIINARVYNIGETDAGSFNVEFIDVTTSQSLGTTNISSLAHNSSQTTSWTWTSPAEHDIKVKVDKNNNVYPEISETNNEAVKKFTGDKPSLDKITAYVVKDTTKYYITDTDKQSFTGIKNISLNTRFVADVSDPNGANTVKNVTFTLNGKVKRVDIDGTDGFSCDIDIGTDKDVNKTWPDVNILTATARDSTNLPSNTKTMTFKMIVIPNWILSMNVSENLKVSFQTSTMDFEMEFSYQILNGTAKGSNDPINKGNKNGITDFTVKVVVGYNIMTGVTKLSGGGELELSVSGYSPSVTVQITGYLSPTLALINATISVEVEVKLTPIPVAGIVIPLPDWLGGPVTIGVVIEGKITVEVSVTFVDESGTFKVSVVSVTVTGRVEGKATIGLGPLAGVYAGVYGEVGVTGQNVKPTISVKTEVGIMAGAYGCGQKWEWSRGWEWEWEKDPFYMSKREWEKLNGTDLYYGNNTIADDLSGQDSPSVASDTQGNTMAVWVQNTSLHSTNIYYSIWNGNAWTTPTAITGNSYYKMDPVIAFDANDNAIVAWTQVDKSFNSSSTIEDLFDASSKFEIYYSKWNGTQWSTPKNITNIGDVAMEFAPAIAADPSGKVMAVWVHDNDGNLTTKADKNIYHSIWNGSKWSAPAAISNMAEADFEPSIAYDSLGNAMVVWVHDNDSTASTFDDVPPVIANATVSQDPVFLPGAPPVDIEAEVTEYMGLYRVYANVTNPLGVSHIINMIYDENSDRYKAQYLPTQAGTYQVKIVAEDVVNQTDTTTVTFKAYSIPPPPPPDLPPVIITADALPNLLYLGNGTLISAHVRDDIGVYEVKAIINRALGGTDIISLTLVSGTPQDGIYSAVYSNTNQPGQYSIEIDARDMPGFQSDICKEAIIVRPVSINREIYCSTWNGNVWSNPTCVTNPIDFQESYNPSVAYDIFRNAMIVWTEYDGSAYKIYHTVIGGAPFGPPKPLPDPGNWMNLDPVIKTLPTGVAIVTWRANPSDWGDLYYFIINSTRYCMEFPEYTMICTLRRLSKDTVVDWKHSVTIDSNADMITVWLKHRIENIGNATHAEASINDNDIYFNVTHIGAPDLEIGTSDINIMTSADPKVGDNIDIRAKIHNTGTFDLKDINATFFDGNPSEGGLQIDSRLIPRLRIGENITVTITWTATFGSHDIYVAVDPSNQILENNEKNNKAYSRILISIIPGSGLNDLETYIGNATINHADTVSLIFDEIVKVVFNGTGTNDYIIMEGNAIMPTIVGGNVTLVPIMPSANVTLNHDGPASLTISEGVVESTFSWLGINDQIMIEGMLATGNVILNHTTPAYLLITNKTVEISFTQSRLDEAMLPLMDAYVKVKHPSNLRFTLENVSDPKRAYGGITQNSIGKFIDINAFDDFEWGIVKIYYDEDELGDLIEASLRLYYWNASTRQWVAVENSGVNTEENYVWGNITHFTIFTPIGAHSIGGADVLIDKFVLLAPYIGFASTILLAIIAVALFIKRFKRRQPQKQRQNQ